MKKNFIILMIFFLFSFSAFAQNFEKIRPKVEISESAKIIEFEEQTEEEVDDELPVLAIKELKLPTSKNFHIAETYSIANINREEFELDIFDDSEKKETAKPKKEKEIKYKYDVLFSVNIESLTNNFGTWKTASLFASRKSIDGKILWGEYRVSERSSQRDPEVFGGNSQRDSEVVGGIYQPLKNRYAFTVEGSYSGTNKFVPKFSIRGEGEKVFKDGWVGHIGGRYKYYDPVKVATIYAQVEKYWGNHRLAYTFNINNVSNAGTAPSNTLSYNKYYGERLNTYGFTVSVGKEEEFVGPVVGVTRSNTFSLTGSLKQWITDDFGLFVDATMHRQGTFYYRRGLNFGVRYRF